MYPAVLTQRCRAPAGKFCQFLTIWSRAPFSEFIQLSKFCRVSAPNMATRVFSDVRQVSRYRPLAPHLTQRSQRPALPGSNRTDLSREAFVWRSMSALGLL